MWTWSVRLSSSAPVRRSNPNTSVHSSKGGLVVVDDDKALPVLEVFTAGQFYSLQE
jgi:hypothetical protein